MLYVEDVKQQPLPLLLSENNTTITIHCIKLYWQNNCDTKKTDNVKTRTRLLTRRIKCEKEKKTNFNMDNPDQGESKRDGEKRGGDKE